MSISSTEIILGTTQRHVVRWDSSGTKVHADVAEPLRALIAAAAESSIKVRLFSGYRSFRLQMIIWNGKATGRRKLLNTAEQEVDVETLTPDETIDHILRWSALPGCSRHHWGTDVDVYDAAAVPRKYKVELTKSEAVTHFAALHEWLDSNMSKFGFFRPYAQDLGGVAPEPWHLSYAPLATGFLDAISVEAIEEQLRGSSLAFKEHVLARLPELIERYCKRVTQPAITQTETAS